MNQIGDAGARYLAEALKVNTAVTSINLNGTSVPAPAGGAGGERGWCAGEGVLLGFQSSLVFMFVIKRAV